MTLLALMRHAETDWNRQQRIQGRTDILLNDAGRASVRARTIPAECTGMRVVTSPLRRCVESAALLGLSHAVVEARLVEMSWGAWEGRKLADLRAELGPAMEANERRGLDFSPPGGETPRQVLARVGDWLAEMAAAGEPTLAVTHRGVIRTVLALAYQWDMLGPPPVKLDCAAFQLFRLDARGLPSAWRINLR